MAGTVGGGVKGIAEAGLGGIGDMAGTVGGGVKGIAGGVVSVAGTVGGGVKGIAGHLEGGVDGIMKNSVTVKLL